MININSDDCGLTFETDGLRAMLGCEISATVNNLTLSEDCAQFVRFISDYVLGGHIIAVGETVGYGYWITKTRLNDRGNIEFWEYNPDATEFVFGVSTTIRYWCDQHQVCKNASSEFAPPRADQMVVISVGVYEGDFVQGVRYPSPPHMSGWWLTTDKYDGNVDSLKTVHAYHVTAKRPDLAKFLALPNCHRFYSDNGDVKFDENVLDGKEN
jgi:hypothetical protein